MTIFLRAELDRTKENAARLVKLTRILLVAQKALSNFNFLHIPKTILNYNPMMPEGEKHLGCQ